MKKLAIIFVLALGLRIFLIGVWYQTGQGDRLSADGYCYRTMAENLIQGKGFQLEEKPTARRPPVYPLFVSFFLKYNLFPLGIQIAHALIGALSCLLLFALAKEIFDEKVGLLASGILAIDYLSVRQTLSIMPETLFVFFLLGTFYFLMLAYREKKMKGVILAGLLAGLSLLTKEVLLFYFPFVVLWVFLWKNSWKNRFLMAGIFSVSLAIVIAPWVVRNSLLYGRPALLTVGGGGKTFYLANNPQATGGITGGDWVLGVDTAMPQDVPSSFRNSPTPDIEEDYFFKEAVNFIWKNPWSFVKLAGKKIVNMWRPYQTDSPVPARWASAVSYAPVLILGLLGLFRSANRWREFFPIFTLIGYIFFLHALLIAHIRYRYPVMPFFMIFASFALLQFFRKQKVSHAYSVN